MKNVERKRNTIVDGATLDTCTGKGLFWELHAQKMLGGKVVSLKRMNQNVDLILPDGRTVDVKSSNVYHRNVRRGRKVDPQKQAGWWVFNRNTKKPVDFFFCIGLDRDVPQRYFMIPEKDFPKRGTVISQHTKKYLRFEYKPYSLPIIA